MFKPCPDCGMMWHFSCHDQSCLDAICSYCEVEMARDSSFDDEEWEYNLCDICHQAVYVTKEDKRDIFGKRHICGNTGTPLQVSKYDGLEPLGIKRKDDLLK